MDRTFKGYFEPNWNRCECGHRLRRDVLAWGNLVHRHPQYGEGEHDLVMRIRAETKAREAWWANSWSTSERERDMA